MASKAEVLGKIDLRIDEHQSIIRLKKLAKGDPNRIFREGNISALSEVKAWVMQLNGSAGGE